MEHVWGTLFFRSFAVFFTLAHGLETLFAALGSICGALHEFGTNQFDNGLLRSIAFAIGQAHYAGVAAFALAESGAELIE